MQQEKQLTKELYDLMLAEEGFYKQKSRIQWIKEGDANTNFFHKYVAARHNRNTITILIDSEGNKVLSASKLAEKVVSFF